MIHRKLCRIYERKMNERFDRHFLSSTLVRSQSDGELPAFQFQEMDVNRNCRIEMKDADYLLRVIIGKYRLY